MIERNGKKREKKPIMEPKYWENETEIRESTDKIQFWDTQKGQDKSWKSEENDREKREKKERKEENDDKKYDRRLTS